jgi:hypothetical protein
MVGSPENLVRLPSFLRRRFMRISACDKNKESEELPQVLEKNLSARTGPLFSREARAPKCWRHSKLGRFFPKNALLLVRFDLSRRIFRSKFACMHARVPKIGDGSQLFLLQMRHVRFRWRFKRGSAIKFPPQTLLLHTHSRTHSAAVVRI